GDAVYAITYSGLAATFSEAGQDLQRLAIEYVHSIILSVGQIKVLLLRVLRKCDIPGGAGATRLTIDKRFLDEAAIGLENLDAIIHPVADIEQAVIGEFNTVHRVSELLCRSSIRVVGPEIDIFGFVSVSAPMPLVF